MNIYLRMRGGLGNQLFQYAYALMLKDLNANSKIILDIREYEHYKIRNFGLEEFVLDEETEISEKDRLKYDRWLVIYGIYRHIYVKFHGHSPLTINNYLCEKGYILGGRSSPLPEAKLPENIYLCGYFQNEKIFSSIRDRLCVYFSLKKITDTTKKILDTISETSIAVSIRCGDDFKKNGIPIYSREYYENGVQYISNLHRSTQLVILSDCIEKVKDEQWFSEFKGEVIYITNRTPGEQIEIMKRCRDFVIANSSFAWWGAYLGSTGKDSVVVAPEYWNAHGVKTTETELVFDNMVIKK